MATTPGPFLRWAGGKRRLAPEILARKPPTVATYYEPFIGGGAVLFAMGRTGLRSVIGDVNAELTNTYSVVRDDVEGLITALTALSGDVSETGYRRVRSSKPTTPVERAARLIYLNRTCFNGLYRVNSKGEFNVPWGKLTNPVVCNADLLRSVSTYLASTEVRTGSFADTVAGAGPGDFVYLDPPYIPLTPTASFSKYAKDDFREPEQRHLAETMSELTDRGVAVLMSNSDTELSREIFGLDRFTLDSVTVARSISASAGSRGRVGEILAYNFDVSTGAVNT